LALPERFDGTERFQILRQLGVGGMGVVYEAFDREMNTRVALKTLRETEPHLLIRFKQEFRALQGLDHPNLVTLLELIADQGRWFFTMELVEGVDFLRWVRGAQALGETAKPTNRRGVPDTVPDVSPSALTMPSSPDHRRVAPAPPVFDVTRLRASLPQLAAGLQRLHRAGKVHRDIKPSNILVRHDGRVVILDFGLVAELDRERNSDSNVVGTVDYMAPEQAAGRPVGPAADWYSVGALLYEALIGETPFSGNPLLVLQDKQQKLPPRPRELVDCPADLDELCMDLLAIAPEDRPSEDAIFQRMGAARPRELPSSPASQPFVGRQREIQLLHQALEDIRAGRQALVFVDGPSGVGKSALVRHFTRRVAAEVPGAVVLISRYYQREAVPFRALDNIMDAVSNYLMRLPPDLAEGLLPLDAGVLAHLFPSLRGVEAVSRGAFRPAPLDPKEQRARVFAAVRELFVRLARRRPVVLVIDDVQWADPDSQAAFAEAMRGPDGPPLLAIATHRNDPDHPELTERALTFLRKIGDIRQLTLDRLPPDDARELAAGLLHGAEGVDAAALAEEAAGHPLFIDALVRHALTFGAHTAGTVRLDEAMAARIDELEAPARQVLELVALAVGPLGQEEALRASGLDQATLLRAIGSLRVQHLLRSTRLREKDAFEPYHDRVRELTSARLGEITRRRRHEALARALEASGHGDPEALFGHWRGADRIDRAVPYGVSAAARAAEALAFDRAARLYREAIELSEDSSELRKMYVALGDALANAGRGPAAAQAYSDALPGAPKEETLELKRRIAEQLLRSGRVDAGLEAVRAVLAEVGLTMPKTPRRALLSLLKNRALLRLRGLGFHERARSEVPPALLTRIDICWSVAGVLAMVDTIRGANFQTLHLRLALDAGEPFRVARALALEGGFSATGGGPTAKRTARVQKMAEELATRVGDPYALGWARGTAGAAAALEGRWKEGLRLTGEAEDIFLSRCGNIAWELSSFQFFLIYSLAFLGRTRELCSRVPESLRHAEERGDLYGAAAHRLALANLVWLCHDEPDEAHRKIAEAMVHWSRESFQVEHFWEMLAGTQAELYSDQPEAAWKRLTGAWDKLAASLLLRVQLTRIEASHVRARAALAHARRSPGERAALLKLVRRIAHQILGEEMPWGTPLGHLLLAGAFAVEQRNEQAAASLQTAIAGLDAADMALYARAARRQLARLRGDGAEVAAADAWMQDELIKRPERMTAMLVPGFDR
jgi:serine/threonine protein kinase